MATAGRQGSADKEHKAVVHTGRKYDHRETKQMQTASSGKKRRSKAMDFNVLLTVCKY